VNDNVCRQLTQLLTDIVHFVAYQENNGGDPFTVQLTHSDRERPKLLREQNVLKQVGHLSVSVYVSVFVCVCFFVMFYWSLVMDV